ncbi:MAG: PTS sugar transporter subunit IIB [Treponema sp.]|nr:PTS sugar transporter subunit IIB [Treponema sp.]
MPRSLKIIVACANGAGTSLMMKMSVEAVARELGIPIEKIHHCAMAEGRSSASQYDIAFVPQNFINMFRDIQEKGTTVIGLRNVLSAVEIKEKLKATELYQSEFVHSG